MDTVTYNAITQPRNDVVQVSVHDVCTCSRSRCDNTQQQQQQQQQQPPHAWTR
eukprot:COSAG06_NODE_12940_length_1310_cov_1.341866_1_plen_52_part_10